MKIDPKYIENSIIEVIDGWVKLTEFGKTYGFALFIVMTCVNNNIPAPFECYASVDPCKLPKNAMIETDDSFILTEKGIKWVCEYIANNPFNSYIFKVASSLKERCVFA